ncbi:ATP-binding cassette domain-containing protein [Bifidobacterium vespertilionis]|nr:energy-coupling factor transporter ATPase [Bifidobacterium vespertilionis]MBT1178661.1 ATP-binding cassette domain-containing protein [Bifidobacterium vespertilionis]
MTSPASAPLPDSTPAIRLRGVRFRYHDVASWALDGIDLTVRRGEYVCVVGANGSGKSTLALIMAGLTAPDDGTVELLGHRVFSGPSVAGIGASSAADGSALGAHPDAYRAARHHIGMVFQNPEDQIVTTVLADDVAFGPENLGMARTDIARHVDTALAAVDMADHAPDDPTHMSGGQQQRSAIAGMLAMDPELLILDEPTAMLDTAARADILRILDSLHTRGTTIVHITHSADEARRGGRIVTVAAGRVTDDRPAGSMPDDNVSADSRPNMRGATAEASTDRLASPTDGGACVRSAPGTVPAIEVCHVSFAYSPDVPVLADLDLTVARGETVALIGRNGTGKSTLARMICALGKPQSGSVTVNGIDVAHAGKRERRELRRHVGYVMQHPERQLFADTVREDVAYGPRNQGLSADEVESRVDAALDLLGIAHLADRSPFDLSGGQQRLAAIAGVMACRPDILVMDEPTASLDAVASARIRELIRTLHARGVTIVLITHAREELSLADRVIDLSHRRPAPHTRAAATATAGPDSTPAVPSAGNGHGIGQRSSDVVSRMDPRVKMALTLVLMFSAFTIRSGWQLVAGAVLVGAAIAVARINPLRLLGAVHPFLALFAVTGAVNVFFVHTGTPVWRFGSVTITDDGLWTMVIYVLRFALVILLGAVFLTRTTPTQMTDAFESLLSPLSRLGVHTHELSLVMSLALRFIPTLTDEAKAIADAQAARGGSIETGSPLQRAKAMSAIVVPVFAGTLRHADNLSRALDARCYEGGSGRTHYRAMAVAGRDVAAMLAAAAYLAALVVLAL